MHQGRLDLEQICRVETEPFLALRQQVTQKDLGLPTKPLYQSGRRVLNHALTFQYRRMQA